MPRSQFQLVSKINLIPKTYFLTFKTSGDLNFRPGQFFSLEVEPKQFRAYSTVHFDFRPPSYFPETESLNKLSQESYISFMISTKPGGKASEYFDNIKLGDELPALGPSGKFSLVKNDKPKVFVATGTGLAPFVGMIEELLEENPESQIKLFFGVWNKESDFAKKFFKKYHQNHNYPNFQIYTVIDDFKEEDLSETNLGGRVTDKIPEVINDLVKYDFYLCGHPAMVSAMNEVLVNKGCEGNIYMEKFGK